MSSVKYTTPPGFTQTLSDAVHYSQAVDLGNGHFKVSGQGGWNAKGEISADVKTETEQTIQTWMMFSKRLAFVAGKTCTT
ncbi:hypothetical protein ACKAV7_003235 [Fusarium commune]